MVWWVAPLIAGIGKAAGRASGKRKQEAAYKANREFMRAEYIESVRRAEREFEYTRGTQEVIFGASGVQMGEGIAGTTISKNRADMIEENRKQMDWLKKSYMMRRRIAKRTGQIVQSTQNYQAASGIASGWFNAYSNQNQINTYNMNQGTSTQSPSNQPNVPAKQ